MREPMPVPPFPRRLPPDVAVRVRAASPWVRRAAALPVLRRPPYGLC